MTNGRAERTFGEAKRIVVKIGSSSLTAEADGRLDPDRVQALVDTLAAARSVGREVVLVSSGAIAAGLEPLGLTRRPNDLPTQQAAASVGQGLLVAHYTRRFHEYGWPVGQVLLTVDDVTRQQHYRNAHATFQKLLHLGVIPIVNENDTVATHEIRFGDNDRLAALVAQLVHADALFLFSDVDALYTDHPSKPNARRIDVVESPDALNGVDTSRTGSRVGTGGMTTKIQAAGIATSAGIPVLITAAHNAAAALAGEDVGTRFTATGKRRPTRQLWLQHASYAAGQVHLDAGAVRAVVERNASLLPVGITEVTGDFEAGEPVNIIAPDGTVVARGLVNFTSHELRLVRGRSIAEVGEKFGPEWERVAVHRDVMVNLVGATQVS
ncbi:glutamate 5-kinase [Granulicoccus sp. GXG6511]|uniref:glutamate 5-kinase n=1 Tax=Granulicoccus sp. GXG6511 TaxID=3381351 RepID=UPI003D7CE26A